ncbi:M61 metallopeptidase family protein [Natronococcus wangiae]|uniref:PGF-CTERM sorting domain-containing protein n=1 Tax=Natronococcus wangiae TaxID=3068275 RepID=UPI00273D9271|nr:PGF-CTERM sorting domain-containing protein [Natronococcus sp. AD5]
MNYRVVVVTVLLIGSLPAGVAGLETGRTPEYSLAEPAVTASPATASDVLHRTTVLRHLPERGDTFETETTFRVPDSVSEFEVDLESEASVSTTDGFERTDDGAYRWTGDDEPTIRFTMPTDRTGYEGHRDGSAATTGAERTAGSAERGYTFVDTGDWGVVRVPSVGISLQRTDPVGHEETVTVEGPGATGGDIAFFGEVAEYERTVAGETIRLAVPAAADLREDPDDVLETLAAASASLDVGASHDEVFVVAVPDDVDWAARGIQYGQSDAWVVADASLEDAPSVWLHEYVHTRQPYANPDVGTATETAWLVEAQAEYYAATLALEQGSIDFREFRSVLERGERSPYADDVLADPGTWTGERTAYVKGPLVYGELDRQIRVETDGDRTLADVFRALSARGDRVTERAFLEAVEDAGGSDVRSTAERYTRTPEAPTAWHRRDHGDAFDLEAPAITTGLDGEGLEVAGEPWDRPAGQGDGSPVPVPVGEPVAVPVALENVDDRDGTADATLAVDGKIVDHHQLALESGERTTTSLAWTPSEPGEYAVRVGDDRFAVLVRSPSSVRVTDLAVEPERADPGDPVTATATVAAADSRPGAAVLEFRTGDETVERPVSVAPGERTTVDATLTFADDGRYEVAVADRSVTVTVGGALSRLEAIPGFGGAVALAALAVAALLLARRR